MFRGISGYNGSRGGHYIGIALLTALPSLAGKSALTRLFTPRSHIPVSTGRASTLLHQHNCHRRTRRTHLLPVSVAQQQHSSEAGQHTIYHIG
jgi:hypothetical protein